LDGGEAGETPALPENIGKPEVSEAERDLSVAAGLLSVAKAPGNAMMQGIQVASEVAETELAMLMKNVTEEQNAILQRKTALMMSLGNRFKRQDLGYVFKMCPEKVHEMGSFSTAVPESLEGRCIVLSIKSQEGFTRGVIEEAGSLGILVKELQRHDGTREFVVIKHGTEKLGVIAIMVPKDVFMKNFHKESRNYKNIVDKSTPTEICKSATNVIKPNHQFELAVKPLQVCNPKHFKIWKELDLLVMGLVNVDEKPAAPPQEAPSAGDAGPGEPEAGEESPKKLKPRKANRAENAKANFDAVVEMRARLSDAQKAERKRIRETSEAAATMSPEAAMLAVQKVGTVVAAAPPQSVVLEVQNAKKLREENEAKKRRQKEIRIAQMTDNFVNSDRARLLDRNFKSKDPILASIELFLNSLHNPQYKRFCPNKEAWLSQIQIIKGICKGRKSIAVKALKFLCDERLSEVTENFDAPWRDLKEQVTDFINEEMITSNGLDPRSAFGRFLDGQSYVKLPPFYLQMARLCPAVDAIAGHFTPLFEKYPRDRPDVASGRDLVAMVMRELNEAAAQVPNILIPNDNHGKGANIKLIMDVIGELLGYVRFSPSILDFLGVVALFLGLKASPISRFVNMDVFRALLLADPAINHDVLVRIADEFLTPDAVLYDDTWCSTPDLANALKFPKSLIVPKLVDASAEDEEAEEAAEGDAEEAADEDGEAEVDEPAKEPSIVAAAAADDGGQAPPAGDSPTPARKGKKRRTENPSNPGHEAGEPVRRSLRERKPNITFLGSSYVM
jgi:hypothetical protein